MATKIATKVLRDRTAQQKGGAPEAAPKPVHSGAFGNLLDMQKTAGNRLTTEIVRAALAGSTGQVVQRKCECESCCGQQRPDEELSLSKLALGNVQKKLTVSSPNDKYEREADQVADRVMRMGDQQTVEPVASSQGS